MVASSSFATTSLGPPPSEKIIHDNYYPLWKAQLLPTCVVLTLLDDSEAKLSKTVSIERPKKMPAMAPN
jgi:hypothetical protein